ncbi:MAG: NAD(P)-dependent oxidoreductase [Rhodocyclales bacterium]|nr:NAD(P)-dependent oxidoreductase [Rhodocyclales bacterium]
MPLPPVPVEDREHILRHTADIWRELAGARFFITGGTGFFGKWLLESIAAANDSLGVDVRATVLSRDPARFAATVPHLAARPELEWLSGEPAQFAPPSGAFDYLLDFATPSALEVGAGGTAIIDHCLQGTEYLLGFAKAARVRRILYASSGAVYGRQPAYLKRIPEDFVADPAVVSPYGRLKQRTETRLLASDIDCVITRGFAFIGPYLPLTDKFAAGSFIRDALAGGPIHILGDGTPIRSYLYATDLAIWLLTLLVKGKPSEAYNVGSNEAISLADVARLIGGTANGITVNVAQVPNLTETQRYVPEISKAGAELGLEVRIPIATTLSKAMEWSRYLSKNTGNQSTLVT